MCNGTYTFGDIGDFFGVGHCAARIWVQKYLDQDSYEAVARKHRWSNMCPDTVQQIVQMRIDGALLKTIALSYGVSVSKIGALLKGVPRGNSDGSSYSIPFNDTGFNDTEPSIEDLQELQQQIDSGEFVL